MLQYQNLTFSRTKHILGNTVTISRTPTERWVTGAGRQPRKQEAVEVRSDASSRPWWTACIGAREQLAEETGGGRAIE